MLVEAELGLKDFIASTDLKAKVKTVALLPDLDGDTLVNKMATEAPAIYVALSNFPWSGDGARLKAGVVCVAKNARGPVEARHGDGKIIGLLGMMEGVASQVDGCEAGGVGWSVTGGDFMNDEVIYKAGLQVGVIRIESAALVAPPPVIDLSALPDFLTVRTDYDLEPFVSAAEHSKWAADPADQSTSKPELSDTLNVRS